VTGSQYLGDRLWVIFDGHCGLCNGLVRWLLHRDSQDRLRFVSSDSPKIIELLARHGINATDAGWTPDSFFVARDADTPAEALLIRSNATIAIFAELPTPWPAVGAVLRWIPRPLRDLGYRLVARWRYRIWGRLEFCPIPDPALRKRFL
jgi:predicted DCC family thiol-disulfide oxidoreductase YuxK